MGTTAFSAQESCTFWKAACLSQVLILYGSQLCITTVLTSLYPSTPSPALLHLTRLWILRSEAFSSKTLSVFLAHMTSLHWEFYEVAMIYVCEYAWVWTSIVVYICVCWGQELIIDVLPYGQPHLPLWDRTSQVWYVRWKGSSGDPSVSIFPTLRLAMHTIPLELLCVGSGDPTRVFILAQQSFYH